MEKGKMKKIAWIGGVAFLFFLALPVLADAFPTRPVTLVCPWPAGGSTDVVMWALAEATGKYLGQPVVIEN
jgi:tripartite-type tricarboxylate transporter receptor subunit TctC